MSIAAKSSAEDGEKGNDQNLEEEQAETTALAKQKTRLILTAKDRIQLGKILQP